MTYIDSARNEVTSGESTFPRRSVMAATVASGNGTLRLTYFLARKTETITSTRTITGGTAGVTPTLCRLGIYEEDSSGNLTLVASTVNDTALWVAGSTVYTKALGASFVKKRGTWYAVGPLIVGAATAPTFSGQNALPSSEVGLGRRLGASVTGQTDLPASILVGSLGDNAHQAYTVLLP